ncbi:MAG TPA: hypothetical protein VFL86_16620 [Burkholderiaceae bacterium]|nr:hypothetical protein [Burkholderiaceae bacterium]
MQHHHHPVLVGAPRDMQAGARPLLLQRSDDDFIEATLDDLRTATGRQGLQTLRAHATDRQGTLKLFQPIQRQFHLALIEAWCDVPGAPRIDAAKVDSAGMVLRRLGAGNRLEGWMRSKGRVRGWLPLARVGGDSVDPGAARRPLATLTGVPDIDRKLTAFAQQNTDTALNEDVIPMYVAPPDVCTEAGKTLFYGMVPTLSSELCEADPVFAVAGDPTFEPQSKEFRDHLVEALRGEAMDLPFPGATVQAWWFDAAESLGTDAPPGVNLTQFNDLKKSSSDNARRMSRFVMLLRQLSVEFNAFEGGVDVTPEVAELKALLHAIELPLVLRQGETVPRKVRADEFLARASTVLLDKGSVSGVLEMPATWPALSDTKKRQLAAALHKSLGPRFKAIKGKSGRFDEPGARYVLRAFVRLKPEGACPGRIVWSEPSQPFVIAPWYEGAGAPPVQIPLPDPSDRNLLKSLKPNVAFVVPPAIQNLLAGSAKDLMEGKGGTGKLGITWICSFSIPVITICAFIVLNIFLSLFNIVFGWMFFLKICLPLPKFGNKPPGG